MVRFSSTQVYSYIRQLNASFLRWSKFHGISFGVEAFVVTSEKSHKVTVNKKGPLIWRQNKLLTKWEFHLINQRWPDPKESFPAWLFILNHLVLLIGPKPLFHVSCFENQGPFLYRDDCLLPQPLEFKLCYFEQEDDSYNWRFKLVPSILARIFGDSRLQDSTSPACPFDLSLLCQFWPMWIPAIVAFWFMKFLLALSILALPVHSRGQFYSMATKHSRTRFPECREYLYFLQLKEVSRIGRQLQAQPEKVLSPSLRIAGFQVDQMGFWWEDSTSCDVLDLRCLSKHWNRICEGRHGFHPEEDRAMILLH